MKYAKLQLDTFGTMQFVQFRDAIFYFLDIFSILNGQAESMKMVNIENN